MSFQNIRVYLGSSNDYVRLNERRKQNVFIVRLLIFGLIFLVFFTILLLGIYSFEKWSNRRVTIISNITDLESPILKEELNRTVFPVTDTEPPFIRGHHDVFEIGIGIADVTGPAAGVNMMGFAKFSQSSSGIHLRQYSRAFIIGDGLKRIIFVSVDAGMISQLVRLQILIWLKEKYGGIYQDANVCLSATHTHSGTGGYFQYLIYLITSLGFVQQSYDALVNGIFLMGFVLKRYLDKSIARAHNNIQKGRIYYNSGELHSASINRSPMAYLKNPAEERKQYRFDVDKEMFLLKFTDLQDNPLGVINWFAVHAVSMNASNHLLSSDNKGYASLLFEKKMEPNSLPGRTKFVSAFAQSNEGDVSPNIFGPICQDTGLPCDKYSSSCSGKCQTCIASGPGKHQFESTKIIAERQFNRAWELFNTATEKITGPIKFISQEINMSNVLVHLSPTEKVTTCKPAFGFSFGAGTVDGPGESDFIQHIVAGKESSFWTAVRNIFFTTPRELEKCHYPKPVLLPTGEMTSPFPWSPSVLTTQILQIGQLAIVAVPGEFTTMAGRRLRNAVSNILKEDEVDLKVVIAGLANSYSSYIATFEEYQFQSYEAASTLYGPHTLDAYIQQFSNLAKHLKSGEEIPNGPLIPDLSKNLISISYPIIADFAPPFYYVGDVVVDVKDFYEKDSVVDVVFVCGHPRNNIMWEETYLRVEILNTKHEWITVATDASWETKFIWESSLLGFSKCRIQWHIPLDSISGFYRIRHFGFSKKFLLDPTPYEGSTNIFKVGG